MIFIICCLAYFIGCIPSQWWMIKADFILLKKKVVPSIIVFDLCKGILATFIAFVFFGWFGACLGAIFVVIGSMYPLFQGFKGGSGLIVSAGALLVLSPILIFIGCCFYVLCFIITRFQFLSTLLTMAVLLILAIFLAANLYVWLVIFTLGVIILFPQKCHWRRRC